MDRAFLRPPLVVRVAMERMQLEIESKQDETLVKQWLDFACQRAASAAQTVSTDKCSPEIVELAFGRHRVPVWLKNRSQKHFFQKLVGIQPNQTVLT